MATRTDEGATQEMCKCGKNPALPEHTCPYQSDVNNDDQYECDCCSDCIGECAMDI